MNSDYCYQITCRACGTFCYLLPEETAWGNLCVDCQRITDAALRPYAPAPILDILGGREPVGRSDDLTDEETA